VCLVLVSAAQSKELSVNGQLLRRVSLLAAVQQTLKDRGVARALDDSEHKAANVSLATTFTYSGCQCLPN